jgi:sarcosine oxidase subunit gamma
VSDNKLAARSPLGGFKFETDAISITEITQRGIVSVATPKAGEKMLAQTIAAEFSTALPTPGKSTSSDRSNARLLGLAADQFFIVFDDPDNTEPARIISSLSQSAYLTDQSDTWVSIRVSGPASRDALERICPIDLHDESFSVGSVARTAMEHLGAIIYREAEHSFALMSAVSSAPAFLHAIETSARNVLPGKTE